MQVKVLVVDDSKFYRNRLCEILTSDATIKIVGTAENGREGVDKALSLKPDVITMDIEMPVMDGISAVREIMKQQPIPILMLSSYTEDGAQATLDALEAGAVDFLLKRLDRLTYRKSDFSKDFCNKIHALGSRANLVGAQSITQRQVDLARAVNQGGGIAPMGRVHRVPALSGSTKMVVIGASTGGPVAVQSILSALPENFPAPVLIVQHMPGTFTGSFAVRLNSLSKLNVKEAEDGDLIEIGKAYVAPGGKQMLVEEVAGRKVIKIRESYEREQYKPSVDISYTSVAEMYGRDVLAIILTGMGADGREGAASLKRHGATVWAQDEASSIVFGMPHAVIDAGYADRVLPINEIATQLASEI